MLTITEGLNRNTAEAIYFGEVVDNNDPLRLQRIRVRLQCYPKAMQIEDLPWASPLRTSFNGGGNDLYGQISVPEIGSVVVVRHLYDQYSPVYIGVIQSSLQKNLVIDNKTDYPRVYGSEDSNGNFYRVELVKKLTKILMDSEIQVTQTGDIKIKLDGDINLTCNNILVKSSSIQIDTGNINTQASDITASKISVSTLNANTLSAVQATANGQFAGTLMGVAYYATHAGTVPQPQPIPETVPVVVPDPMKPSLPEDDFKER